MINLRTIFSFLCKIEIQKLKCLVQQAQQQQQAGAGTELYTMDYESLGTGTFHPVAPSAALHFGPFAPQFGAAAQVSKMDENLKVAKTLMGQTFLRTIKISRFLN